MLSTGIISAPGGRSIGKVSANEANGIGWKDTALPTSRTGSCNGGTRLGARASRTLLIRLIRLTLCSRTAPPPTRPALSCGSAVGWCTKGRSKRKAFFRLGVLPTRRSSSLCAERPSGFRADHCKGAIVTFLQGQRKGRQIQNAVIPTNIQVQWLPAHCTLEEFEAKGLPAAIWHGNDMADKAAKQVLLDAMDQAHCPADTTGKQLLHTAAKIQKATLSLQPRWLGDQAAEKEATRARNGVKVLHPMAR